MDHIYTGNTPMTSTLFTPKGKQLQGLTKRFWSRYDNSADAAELFRKVRPVMTALRFGPMGKEYKTPPTDDEALADLWVNG
jgi:hypothetical protein